MTKLLTHLLTSITDHPDQVKVTKSQDQSGTIILTASVHPEDMGKVIGKQGRVINALRTIVKITALKQGLRLQINLQEPAQEPQTPPSD